MLVVPPIPRAKNGEALNFGKVNHIIKRTEYAADLITNLSFESNTIFVSVVDETSISRPILQSQATLFIGEYGSKKPIYVLCPNIPALPFRGLDQLQLDVLPAAKGFLVGRTDIGGPITDWLSLLPKANYRIAIDNSGSMTQETVQDSYTLFLNRCRSLKRKVTSVNMSDYGVENWIGPHLGQG